MGMGGVEVRVQQGWAGRGGGKGVAQRHKLGHDTQGFILKVSDGRARRSPALVVTFCLTQSRLSQQALITHPRCMGLLHSLTYSLTGAGKENTCQHLFMSRTPLFYLPHCKDEGESVTA